MMIANNFKIPCKSARNENILSKIIWLISTFALATLVTNVVVYAANNGTTKVSSTRHVRPSTGRATLVPGQPLHFQCETIGREDTQFMWFRKLLVDGKLREEERLEPSNDDTIQIHNERFTLLKPTSNMVGNYLCRALNENKSDTIPNEVAEIQVRMQPYIEDFGLGTSHTGKSSVLTEGERLEMICTVRDNSTPVNITWLRSMTPDDERTMVPLSETPPSNLPLTPSSGAPAPLSPAALDAFAPTFTVPDQNIVVERLDSHSKRLVIESVKHEHRSYYVCMADNGITERTRIVAELFILFTIIHVWETQRAYRQIQGSGPPASTAVPKSAAGTSTGPSAPVGNKRPASGTSAAFENVPLTSF